MALSPRVRLALALWSVWAALAWNVAFDRMLVLAGRRYVFAAATAASASRPFVLVSDWMRPATARALTIATAIAASILGTGLALIAMAARREPRTSNPEPRT
jgi:hypothetical protein